MRPSLTKLDSIRGGCRPLPGSRRGRSAMAITAMPRRRIGDVEWQTRVDLAACYRLVDLFGWSDLINTRITARIPNPQEGQPHRHFLINRFGMLYDEITASSLVKLDS